MAWSFNVLSITAPAPTAPGYEENLLPSLLFAANLGKELIQIVENFHVGVSFIRG